MGEPKSLRPQFTLIGFYCRAMKKYISKLDVWTETRFVKVFFPHVWVYVLTSFVPLRKEKMFLLKNKLKLF